ncbi:MAG: biotin/lipoyl-binding protein, partial [Syntrophomonadaceae bacterium]|nr:biotin/lipoyl-binding protein [Syntrophomonadaceae bacterium]
MVQVLEGAAAVSGKRREFGVRVARPRPDREDVMLARGWSGDGNPSLQEGVEQSLPGGAGRRGERVVNPRPGFLLVLALALALLASGCGQKQEETSQENVIPVEVQAVDRGEVAQAVRYAGTLRGIEEAVVYPKLAGTAGTVRVAEVKVRPGDRVARGQSLVQLDAADLQYQIAAAQAQVDGLLARR